MVRGLLLRLAVSDRLLVLAGWSMASPARWVKHLSTGNM
jgi:hypothetical protein